MNTNAPARIIAFYLPQFHPVPENNVFWERGFTEWTNVGKAKPLYHGHRQPKLPTELGYYDLRVPEVREQQANLARQYGVEGFCYWHYWFGHGKQMLHKPLKEMVESGRPDFPFCIGWANESWFGFEHGVKSKSYLIQQTYPGEADDRAHFHELLPAFKDTRYIRVDGKLLFVIYHPLEAPEAIRNKIALWRKLAAENGIGDFHFVGISYFPEKEADEMLRLGIDAINVCRFHDFKTKKKSMFRRAKFLSKWLRRPIVVSYKEVIDTMVAPEDAAEGMYPTVYSNWDHTPRSGRRGVVFEGSTPTLFGRLLDKAIDCVKNRAPQHRLLFLKSWNEWGEGNYVEPDREFGRGYLEAIASRIHPNQPANQPKVSVLVAAYGQAQYLGEALQSLVDQTYTNWEAIVVDDGSPDNVATIAQQWADRDRRIKFFHTDNNGVAAARNFAASKATGKYVMCLDADDMLCPTYISRCVEVLEEIPEIRVVYTAWEFFGATSHTPKIDYTDFRDELLHNNIHVSAMMRLTEFRKVGGFDESMRTAMEDWEFWIRVLGDDTPNQVRLIPQPLFRYRRKSASRDANMLADTDKISRCRNYIFNKHRATYKKYFGEGVTADMLALPDKNLVDLLANPHRQAADIGAFLTNAVNGAKKLARSTDAPLTKSERFLAQIADILKPYKGQAAEKMNRKNYSRFVLLTENPQKFLKKMRWYQQLMPKNWCHSNPR